MNAEIALTSILGLAGLWFFLTYFWRDYRIDALRDDLFALRDKLFVYAAEKNIEFDDPAYTILRERMNTLIRFAHQLTLTKFLTAMVMIRRHQDYWQRETHPWIVKWEESVQKLPEQTRAAMNEFNTSLLFMILKHMVLRSFFRYLIVRPLVAVVKIKIDVRHEVVSNPQVVSSVEQVESEALDQDASRVGKALAATA